MSADLQHEGRSFQSERTDDAEDQGPIARLVSSGMIEHGGVVVLELEAIRARLGERWPYKRSQVWETIEHHLSRRLRPEDFHAQIGETELLLATGDSREITLARALNIQKELLTFFLGRQLPRDLKISQVVSIDGDLMVSEPIDRQTMARAAAASQTAHPAATQPGEAAKAWSALSFLTTEGHDVELTFEFERVMSLDSFAGAAVRVRPVVWDRASGLRMGSDWRKGLAFVDELNIDLATLDAARPLYVETLARKVIVPCSLAALASIRGRAGLIGRMSRDEAAASASLIVEILGVDGGTPAGQLVEASSVLRRHCKAVIGRTDLSRTGLQVLKEGQLAGLSVDCSEFPDADRALLAALWNVGKLAKPVAKLLLTLGLPSMDACRMAQAVGATHASMRQPLTAGLAAA